MSYLGVEYQNLAHDDPEHEREWRSLTHAKTVPVLVDGDLVLTDSPVMLEYLQDLHGGLLPADPGDRARVRSPREIVFAKRGIPEADWDAERIATGTRGFLGALPELAERLGDREFFSDRYSVADAALTGRFALTAAYGVEIPARFENLARWFESRLEDGFFVSASPPVVTDWLAGRPVREAS
jgi:glutathione S-transferase